MSTDIDVLNFYTKGKSIIRGSFPISSNDQNLCGIPDKTTVQENLFIDESDDGSGGGGGGGGGPTPIIPFVFNGPIYDTTFDPIDGKIYVCGNFTISYGNKIYKQAARFNYDGSFDPTFDVNQGYGGNPFYPIPTSIKRIGDYVWFANSISSGAASQYESVINFYSQGTVSGNIHKVDLNGNRDTNFVPYAFSYYGSLWDYYINPADNCIIMNNWLEVAFRNATTGAQLVPSIPGSVNTHGLVIPNTSETPSVMYICQRTVGGIDAANNPRGLKAINTATKSLDSGTNTLMGLGLVSPSDNYGFTTGKVSPRGDYMILNRLYSGSSNNPGYWQNGTLDQKLFVKVYLPSLTSPNSSYEWNTTGHFRGSSAQGISGEIMIDNQDRIYIVTANFTQTFSGISKPANTLVRLNRDCTLDTTFSISNRLTGNLNKVFLISDNDILICGNFTAYDGDTSKRYLLRINANGDPLVSIQQNI